MSSFHLPVLIAALAAANPAPVPPTGPSASALPERPVPAEVLVLHALTGAPLPGARVTTEVGDTTRTDDDGLALVDPVPTGSVLVELPGFVPLRVRVRSGRRVTVSLLPDGFDLHGLVVDAVRGGRSGAVTEATLDRPAVEARWAGAEMPEVLAATPAVTSVSDAGIPFGYTYIRLRGLDQTRIAVSVDGVPLNEPEDQGVYFSNFPDFANSVASVQVQRGVGTSTFGAASYAGAVHLETVSPAVEPRGLETQLSVGSFGTARGSVEGATGLGSSRLAAYGRVSSHTTDGWREHSGSRSYSWLARGGWYGDRDQLQLLALGGRSWNDMAYLATAESDLVENPRLNYLTDDETDDFRQTVLSLAWSRVLADGLTWTTRLYRTDLAGHYDILIDGMWRFGLESDWNGLVSYGRARRGPWTLDAGVHLSGYTRDHRLHVLPDLEQAVYENAGHRDEQSAFVRVERASGAWTWSADAQVRRSGFRYEPDAANGVDPGPVAWTFFNPRVGAVWRPARGWELWSSVGRTTREPTRNDLFAGFDDLGPTEAAFIGDLEAVRPESAVDVEAGVRRRGVRGSVSAGLYWMEFRDEIAPIGRLSYIGLPLRKNVERSVRRGIEVTWTVGSPGARVRGGGDLAGMWARIDRWVDDASGAEHRDVPPLLTPAVVGGAWGELRLPHGWRLRAEADGASRQYLANDGDPRFTAPGHVVTHGAAVWRRGRQELRLQVRNLLDATAWRGGYHDGVEPFYYPMAGRALMLTWTAGVR